MKGSTLEENVMKGSTLEENVMRGSTLEEIVMRDSACKQRSFGHPCFDAKAHFKVGRIHLPVAPGCNIKCKYCVRRFDCTNENRPGVTSKVITPKQALAKVEVEIKRDPRIAVVAVAGPGEPLANEKTFETFKLIHQNFPHLTKCVSTNGWFLAERLDTLQEVGVTTLTITINALSPTIGKDIYSWVMFQGKRIHGETASELLIQRQLEGLKAATERGIRVKINSVLIPGVNEEHLSKVAKKVAELGAHIQNIMPLIPQGELAHLRSPTPMMLEQVRFLCELHMPQFQLCKQCRADAVGVPSEE